MKTRNQRGFTLLELMISLLIGAVLLAVGVPAFNSLVKTNRMIAMTNEVVTVLQYARSEAIKRNNPVTICVSSDSATCSGSTNWESGWIVFDDINGNAQLDNATPLRSLPPNDADTTVRVTAGNVVSTVSFNGDGFPRAANGAVQTATFSICDDRGIVAGDNVARAVLLGASGRSRSSTDQGLITCP